MKREHMDAVDRLIYEAQWEEAIREAQAETQKLVDTTLRITKEYRDHANLCCAYAAACWICFIAFVVWKATS